MAFVTKLGFFGDLAEYLVERRVWWLLPIIVLMLFFGVLFVLSRAAPLAAVVYPLF